MKKIILTIVAYVVAMATSVSMAQTEDGTFSIMTLNVDGLPGKFLMFDVNKDCPKSDGSLAISKYILSKDCDIIAMQEDFNYRWEIWSHLFANYDHDEWTGGVIFEEMQDCDFIHPQNIKLPCDGLNMSWKKNSQSTAYERVAWEKSFGKFSHEFDDIVTKGFRRHEMTLENGKQLVVYNMHMDASSTRDERLGNDQKDREARQSQWEQLRDHILVHLDSRPIVVVGDMNSLYHKDSVESVFINAINATGRATSGDAWVTLQRNGIYPKLGDEPQKDELLDKVIYINPTDADYTIIPVSYEVDKAGYTVDGEPLGDHYPVIVHFNTLRSKNVSGVNTVNSTITDEKWYSPQGVRQHGITKGINISGSGKKVLVR